MQLIGNLGGVPEVREFGGNGKVARVGLATGERYKNAKGEYVTETTWHNLVIWGRKAEAAAKVMRKGAEVAVEGKIVNRSYEDKDRVKRYVSEVHVNDFVLLGGRLK